MDKEDKEFLRSLFMIARMQTTLVGSLVQFGSFVVTINILFVLLLLQMDMHIYFEGGFILYLILFNAWGMYKLRGMINSLDSDIKSLINKMKGGN